MPIARRQPAPIVPISLATASSRKPPEQRHKRCEERNRQEHDDHPQAERHQEKEGLDDGLEAEGQPLFTRLGQLAQRPGKVADPRRGDQHLGITRLDNSLPL